MTVRQGKLSHGKFHWYWKVGHFVVAVNVVLGTAAEIYKSTTVTYNSIVRDC